MSRFLYENHRGSPTLTLLNVLGVLGVLNVLNVVHVLNMPMDASLACWALFNELSKKVPVGQVRSGFEFATKPDQPGLSSSIC